MNLVLPRNPKYGWIPDLPDQRDMPYSQLEAAAANVDGSR